MSRRIFGLMAIVLLACPPADAQTGRAGIWGTVRDQQGSVMVGVSVAVTHLGTNTRYSATTNEVGLYRVPGIQVGTYQISAEAPGFRRAVRSGIVLQVDDNAQVDFRLELGPVVEAVEVTAAAPLVDASGATVGKVIENTRITGLPLNGRSALSLVALTPNVRSHAQSAHGFADRGLLVTAFSVNGGPAGMNNITLDGATNINARAGDTNINPTVEAIEEFKVQSGTMSAEYGYTVGGVVNMVIKSGTNRLHGALYEFLRNDALDARNTFASTKAPFRYNQYGGAVGGPIRRDRSFFFVNFEEWKFRRSYTAIGTTPTAAERRGNFSELRDATGRAIAIYDPATTRANPNGSGFVRDPFPGNIIPANRLDKVSQSILQFYPLPNRTPTNLFTNSNNFQANLGARKDARQLAVKIDHRFTPKNFLAFHYVLWNHKDDNAATGSGYFPDPIARMRNDDYTNRNVKLSNTHFFSGNFIHEFRFAVVRQHFPFQGAAVGGGWVRKLGLPESVPDITFPRVQATEIQTFPSGFGTFFGTNAMHTFQLVDSITLIKGKHSLKAGVELRRNLNNSDSCSNCSGTFVFNARLTGNPQQLAGSGSGLASMMLGSVASASIDSNVGSSNPNIMQAYFLQDDWKVTRRLTLNLGFRYDYQQIPSERHNGLSRFNPSAINPETGLPGRLEYAGVDFGRLLLNPDYNDFSPRVGFALDVFGTGRTVLRGGYGIYYPLTFIYSRSFGAQGFRGNSTSYTAPGGNLDLPAFQFQNGFPFPVVLPQGSKLGPSAFLSQNVSFDEVTGRSPYSQQYTLTLQQQLPGGYLLEAGYSGNKGTKLGAGNYDYNQMDPRYLSLGRALLDRVPNPYAGQVPGTFGGATITRQQSLRPFPYYNTISVSGPHMGSSSYHAVLLNVEKRMSQGFVMLASYTFGKLISDGVFGYSQAGTEQVNVLDYQNGKFDRRSERAVDSTDSASRLVMSGIWELPFGSTKRWRSSNAAVNKLIGGWQVDLVLVLQNGLPVVVRGANNFLATRPNSTGTSAKLENPTAGRWFDTTQFVNPADFTYGNVGRTLPDVRGPGINNIDFSLIKNTILREGLNLQFRAEAFNLANHVNLLAPDGTFVPGADGRNRSATFGTITAARDARIVQLGVKLLF